MKRIQLSYFRCQLRSIWFKDIALLATFVHLKFSSEKVIGKKHSLIILLPESHLKICSTSNQYITTQRNDRQTNLYPYSCKAVKKKYRRVRLSNTHSKRLSCFALLLLESRLKSYVKQNWICIIWLFDIPTPRKPSEKMLTIKFKVISQMRSYTNQASSLLPESRQKNSERDCISNHSY